MQLGGRLLDAQAGMNNLKLVEEKRGSRSLQHRSKVMLAAVLVVDFDWIDVRIRDLSRSGALLEGNISVAIGKSVEIKRNEHSVLGEVVWSSGNRCGVAFATKIVIEDWVGASLPAAREPANLSIVGDNSTTSVDPSRASGPAAQRLEALLPRRVGEEIGYVQRLIETIAIDLTSSPGGTHRHSGSIQSCRQARQLLGELAQVLMAEDSVGAAQSLATQALKNRLLR